MRDSTPELRAYLASKQSFIMANLYSIKLITGLTYYYTDADYDIVSNGNLYISNDIQISRGKTRIVIGSQIDTLDLDITAKPENLLNGSSWLSAVRKGALDGATVRLEKVFMPDFGDVSLGTIVLFQGAVGDVSGVGRFKAQITVNSDLQLLDIDMPRNIYQSGCRNLLYALGCNLIKDNYQTSGVTQYADSLNMQVNFLQSTGYYDLGVIKFTSGINSGVSKSIRSQVGNMLTMVTPFITPPAVGDTFIVYPGCDRTQGTCTTKFNNLVNFRAEPYVPIPETAT